MSRLTQENEGQRKILSVIPILRFARAILLTSALISFYQISSWQWQQSEFHFDSNLPTIFGALGMMFAFVVTMEIHYGIRFYRFPSNYIIDSLATISLMGSILLEVVIVSYIIQYTMIHFSVMAIVPFQIHTALFVTCFLIEGGILLSAYSKMDRKKTRRREQVNPEYHPIVLIDEIIKQREKDRG